MDEIEKRLADLRELRQKQADASKNHLLGLIDFEIHKLERELEKAKDRRHA